MSPSFTKILYSFLAAGSLTISSVSLAAVYDFGGLLTESRGYAPPNSFRSASFSQMAAIDSGEDVLNFIPSINNNFFSGLGDKEFIGPMSFDITPDASVETNSASHWNNGGRSSNISLSVKSIDVAYSATYVPITSPVREPETYAIILAGLVLIAFTARRRKDIA